MQLPVPCLDTTTGAHVTRTVTCYYPTKGLAVQRQDRTRDEWLTTGAWLPTWGVVHLPSGQLVVRCVLPSRAKARRCQQALLALPIDWTQPDTAAWRDAIRPLVAPVLAQWAPDERRNL